MVQKHGFVGIGLLGARASRPLFSGFSGRIRSSEASIEVAGKSGWDAHAPKPNLDINPEEDCAPVLPYSGKGNS